MILHICLLDITFQKKKKTDKDITMQNRLSRKEYRDKKKIQNTQHKTYKSELGTDL